MLTTLPLFLAAAAAAAAAVGVAAPVSGCGQTPPLAPGASKTFYISSSGGNRSYILYLPTTYKPATVAPLVLNFAGHGDTDSYQEQLTLLDQPYFNSGHVIVYPEGQPGTDVKLAWSGAPYANSTVNDLVFTDDLLDNIQAQYCIDTTRIFATGKSNGGGFVNYLACHPQSARFAAFAPVAGAYYPGFGADGTSCTPTRSPQPFLEIHGYNDTTIPYYGGTHGSTVLPNVLGFVGNWSVRNGCSMTAKPASEYGGLVNNYDFGCHTHHYAVYRADHVWESTIGNADTERYSYGPSAINASTVVMNFFLNVPPLSQS